MQLGNLPLQESEGFYFTRTIVSSKETVPQHSRFLSIAHKKNITCNKHLCVGNEMAKIAQQVPLKGFVSTRRPRHKSSDKAFKKTDRANRRLHSFSFSSSAVISQRSPLPSRYIALPSSNTKITFPSDSFASGIFLNVYLQYPTC